MAVANPDTETLLLELNSVRAAGTLLTNEILIRKIRNLIQKDKGDVAWYHLSLAALYVLTGEYELMRKHETIGLKSASPQQISWHCVTLITGGFFSDALETFDLLDDHVFFQEDGSLNNYYVSEAASHFSIKRLFPIVSQHDSKYSALVKDAHHILEKHGIEERVVLEMLDLAGAFLREHKLLVPKNFVAIPSFYNKTLNISIPVKLSAKDMAKLEWEFSNILFEKMPDAPLKEVHVGFTCAP